MMNSHDPNHAGPNAGGHPDAVRTEELWVTNSRLALAMHEEMGRPEDDTSRRLRQFLSMHSARTRRSSIFAEWASSVAIRARASFMASSNTCICKLMVSIFLSIVRLLKSSPKESSFHGCGHPMMDDAGRCTNGWSLVNDGRDNSIWAGEICGISKTLHSLNFALLKAKRTILGVTGNAFRKQITLKAHCEKHSWSNVFACESITLMGIFKGSLPAPPNSTKISTQERRRTQSIGKIVFNITSILCLSASLIRAIKRKNSNNFISSIVDFFAKTAPRFCFRSIFFYARAKEKGGISLKYEPSRQITFYKATKTDGY